MKKIYTLIFTIILSLSSTSYFNSIFKISDSSKTNISNEINDSNFLFLNSKNGHFFSWNKEDTTSKTTEQVIGIYSKKNTSSYLLTNFGTFIKINYNITNFLRIDNTYGLATIRYYKHYNKNTNQINEYTNKTFLVKLNNKRIDFINFVPLYTINTKFCILDKNDIIAYGNSLDLINISDKNDPKITNLSPVPSSGTNNENEFFTTSDNSGVFLNNNGNYEFFNNITNNLEITNLNISGNLQYKNNLVMINNTNFILRANNGSLYFFQNLNVNNPKLLNEKSLAINFAFNINNKYFMINKSSNNSSTIFGTPELLSIDQPNKIVKTNLKNEPTTLNNMIFNTNNKGVFIDGDDNAFTFNLDSNFDSNFNFNYVKLAKINSYSAVNNNLGFTNIDNNEYLYSFTNNEKWSEKQSINISVADSNTLNILNKEVIDENNTVIANYKNTYASNQSVNISINNSNLKQVTFTKNNENPTTIEKKNNTINYTFEEIGNYQLKIEFNNSTIFNYQIIISPFNFSYNKIIKNENKNENITNYVGYNVEQNIYNIKAIEQDDYYIISFLYKKQKIANISLISYSNDNLVVKNIISLNENSIISNNFINPEKNASLYAIKITNLLGQNTFIYLGFYNNNNTIPPMPKFWNSDKGKQLRSDAIKHNYSNKQLDAMNAQEINNLLVKSQEWQIAKIQGYALVYTILFVCSITSIIIFTSVIYNKNLNNKIKSKKLKKILVVK